MGMRRFYAPQRILKKGVRIHQTLRVTPAMEAGLPITFGNWRRLSVCWISLWRNKKWRQFTYRHFADITSKT
jgi:hypothetical protein